MAKTSSRSLPIAYKTLQYIILIFLACLSLLPFVIMIVNSTRDSASIQAHAVSFIPSTHLKENYAVFGGKLFNPWRGFLNSLIISTGATFCTIYFSTLTAFAIVAYDWKASKGFFALIMCFLMIPQQVVGIGFFQFMYSIDMVDSFIPLILPSIAAPSTVFFMRQYMLSSLPMEILQSARIDGAGEFRIFNQIALPMMKPAMATQAIFSFVISWNNLFMPQILLTSDSKYTMPLMVSQLRGDTYKAAHGAIYLGLTMSVLPLFVIYFALSKYIIAGVALGGVKE